MSQGVVASGHPSVTEAAGETLGAGGNAFDAAVAAGFAASVAEPMFTSLGGGGFLLARTRDGQAVLIDFFVDVPGRGSQKSSLEPHFFPVTVRFPASDQIFNVGLASVAVPGTLRGLLYAQRRLGRLSLQEVIAPAIQLARDGVTVDSNQFYILELLAPITMLGETGRSLYAPEGRPPRVGERIANRDLAAFLEDLVAHDDRGFYAGSLARRVAREMCEGGGFLTEEDLQNYSVIEREPLLISYRDFRLLTNPPPSFGGSMIALSLELLATVDLDRFGWGSCEHLEGLVAVMIEVERSREGGAAVSSPPALAAAAQRVSRATSGTTQISVCDSEGNAASMTLSNGEGSGCFVPGSGIQLNNMLGEDGLHPEGFHSSPPGQRVSSMMSPSLLLGESGVKLIIGSGGSKRIHTALVQVISNMVDFGMNVQEAVNAPRLHWDGGCVQLEPGFDPASVRALSRGHRVNLWSEQNLYFGGVNAIAGEDGAGDPRRGGATARFSIRTQAASE